MVTHGSILITEVERLDKHITGHASPPEAVRDTRTQFKNLTQASSVCRDRDVLPSVYTLPCVTASASAFGATSWYPGQRDVGRYVQVFPFTSDRRAIRRLTQSEHDHSPLIAPDRGTEAASQEVVRRAPRDL